jgi:hypothetical protein
MNRSLKVERIYSLGDYKNIKVTDDINELPEELVLNDKAVGLVRMMQLLQTEKVYQKYVNLGGLLKGKSQEDVFEMIDELESDTMSKLKEIFKNGKTEN